MDDGVVAEAAVEDVDPVAADQYVVAVAATESVSAVAADQDIVASSAVGGKLDGARRETRRLDDVVAGESLISIRSPCWR